eukprot:2579005-Prymnesium_polylepis.2
MAGGAAGKRRKRRACSFRLLHPVLHRQYDDLASAERKGGDPKESGEAGRRGKRGQRRWEGCKSAKLNHAAGGDGGEADAEDEQPAHRNQREPREPLLQYEWYEHHSAAEDPRLVAVQVGARKGVRRREQMVGIGAVRSGHDRGCFRRGGRAQHSTSTLEYLASPLLLTLWLR